MKDFGGKSNISKHESRGKDSVYSAVMNLINDAKDVTKDVAKDVAKPSSLLPNNNTCPRNLRSSTKLCTLYEEEQKFAQSLLSRSKGHGGYRVGSGRKRKMLTRSSVPPTFDCKKLRTMNVSDKMKLLNARSQFVRRNKRKLQAIGTKSFKCA